MNTAFCGKIKLFQILQKRGDIMQQKANEIEKVLEKHAYSINSIICDVMKKFKFKTLCFKAGMKKESGYSVTEIISIVIMFPLMLLKSVRAFYESDYKKITEMKKDVIYRLKNNEKMPWRNLQYQVLKRFKELVKRETSEKEEISEESAFIIDDTAEKKTGEKIEGITFIHDHSERNRNMFRLGFKLLNLGLFDGESYNPVDFSLHGEKKLKRKKQEKQYKKECIKNSNGYKRRRELNIDKITMALRMVRRAVKHGLIAKYTLFDSWFGCEKMITGIREIRNGIMHVICGMKKDKRRYSYDKKELTAKQIIKTLREERKEKRCRKWRVRYYEVDVNYGAVGDVRLYMCRFPHQKEWRVFLSTNTELTFVEMIEIYMIRWTIEVFFKEIRQYLQFGKCQSRDFDAQIADITMCFILYIFLSYFRRMNAYETIGAIFEIIKKDMIEKNLAERLWELFEELIQIVIEAIESSGTISILQFRKSEEYKTLKEMFEQSFLGNQILELDKAA